MEVHSTDDLEGKPGPKKNMSHLEKSVLRRFSGARITLWSVVARFAGITPLLRYVAFGSKNGNPIGLGLLAAVAVLVAGIGLAIGLIKTPAQSRSGTR
jgi:hypothetical protein